MNAVASQVVVREATLLDIPTCAVQIEALRQESWWKHVPVKTNVEYGITKLAQAILGLNGTHLLVVEVDGLIVGVCYAGLDHYVFLPEVTYLVEGALYLLPEYRGSRIGAKLWQAMCAWGKAQGAVGGMYCRLLESNPRRGREELQWRYWGELGHE